MGNAGLSFGSQQLGKTTGYCIQKPDEAQGRKEKRCGREEVLKRKMNLTLQMTKKNW